MRIRILSYMPPFFVISAMWLMILSSLVTNLYAVALQAIPQITHPTNINRFMTYENNSTLGIKIQYPSNWQIDNYNNKIAFFAPSSEEGNKKIIPVAVIVRVDTLPFQVIFPEEFISQYVDNLKKNTAISEPIRVNLTNLAGNLAHNITFSSNIGQNVYHTIDIIMLSGIKKYEITCYIAQLGKFYSYIPTIQRIIDSFEININMIKSAINRTTSNTWFATYENNSTLGIKIQYPSNWKQVEYGNMAVIFLSPSESNSDRFLESFSIRITPSNNKSINELANQSISNYTQQYVNFHTIESKATTLKGNPAYIVKYQYQDQLFGKAMAIDIGMIKAGKLYVLSYIAEPAKFYSYMPTIQRIIDSFTIEGQSSNETNSSRTVI